MQYFIHSGIYFNQIFMSSWQVLHSLLYFVSFPSGSFSCNISFLVAFISIKFSFLYDNYFILSLFCLISLWQLFHAIFHSSRHLFQLNFYLFMAATSFSFGLCFISFWQLFHVIFHSSWHLFSFLHGSYFILCWILSHSPLVAISCNISFLSGSYFNHILISSG